MKSAGDNIFKKNSNWSFKGNVYKNFDKHIQKSIPMYEETYKIYLKLSDFFLQDNSKIIDIGCSTGKFLSEIYLRHKKNQKKIKYIGLDIVKEMIAFSKRNNKSKKINFFLKDVYNYNLNKACIISSFYTMQFISPKKRQFLFNKIYKSLNWGGAFFLVEKVRAPDARFQDIMNQVYLEFKIEKGFSSDEIINKSRSLKSVMEPFSTKGNIDLLKRAGFKDIVTVFKHTSFEGFLAIK
jgi:tRNA (cmo5U34)-methyltransferase